MAKKRRASARGGMILSISRPLKAFLVKFMVVFVIVLSIFIIFVSNIDSPFTKSVKEEVNISYAYAADIISTPFVAVKEFFVSIDGYFFIISKNSALAEDNLNLRKKLASLTMARAENIKLKKLLNFVKDRPYKIISADIIGNAGGPFLRTVMINAGANHNIKEDMAVINDRGLVGRVTAVFENSSQILLLNDINSKIPIVSSLSRQRAIIAGRNTKFPKLLYLNKENALLEGEEVVTSGDGNLFPPDLPVGVVRKDKKNNFIIEPYAKWQNLDHVSVILY